MRYRTPDLRPILLLILLLLLLAAFLSRAPAHPGTKMNMFVPVQK